MTALKPIENLRVIGVASERYPGNEKCAHPECNEPVTLRPDGTPTVHHIFPKSLIKSDSYFVEIIEDIEIGEVSEGKWPEPIPHATGLCGSGTTGHHGDVEEHRAWIKLEDGVFVWYDRAQDGEVDRGDGQECMASELDGWKEWVEVGPLNPQPGSREGKPKRKKHQGEARRQRTTISIKVPQDDQEDGAGLWDELIEQLRARYDAPDMPVYNVAMRAFYEALTS